jgi:hypothetical protein
VQLIHIDKFTNIHIYYNTGTEHLLCVGAGGARKINTYIVLVDQLQRATRDGAVG